jgi:hypothetical protein
MTEDEKQKVIDLWEQGMTGQAIGEMLGVSRCSILGFINRQRRNGYEFKRPFEKFRALRNNVFVQKVVKAKIAKEKKEKKAKVIKPKKPKKNVFKAEVIDTKDHSVNLMGLTRLSCRYPISPDEAPEMIFCGKPQEHGSYCKEHGAICYYPARQQSIKSVD